MKPSILKKLGLGALNAVVEYTPSSNDVYEELSNKISLGEFVSDEDLKNLIETGSQVPYVLPQGQTLETYNVARGLLASIVPELSGVNVFIRNIDNNQVPPISAYTSTSIDNQNKQMIYARNLAENTKTFSFEVPNRSIDSAITSNNEEIITDYQKNRIKIALAPNEHTILELNLNSTGTLNIDRAALFSGLEGQSLNNAIAAFEEDPGLYLSQRPDYVKTIPLGIISPDIYSDSPESFGNFPPGQYTVRYIGGAFSKELEGNNNWYATTHAVSFGGAIVGLTGAPQNINNVINYGFANQYTQQSDPAHTAYFPMHPGGPITVKTVYSFNIYPVSEHLKFRSHPSGSPTFILYSGLGPTV